MYTIVVAGLGEPMYSLLNLEWDIPQDTPSNSCTQKCLIEVIIPRFGLSVCSTTHISLVT